MNLKVQNGRVFPIFLQHLDVRMKAFNGEHCCLFVDDLKFVNRIKTMIEIGIDNI